MSHLPPESICAVSLRRIDTRGKNLFDIAQPSHRQAFTLIKAMRVLSLDA